MPFLPLFFLSLPAPPLPLICLFLTLLYIDPSLLFPFLGPLMGLGSAVNFPSGFRGGVSGRLAFLAIFNPEHTSGDNRFSNPTCALA